MNHCIGGVRTSDPDQVEHERLHINSEATREMINEYKGKGVHLLQTVGDCCCGIDLCGLILEREPTPQTREKVMEKLCEVGLKSIGNRTFVYLMQSNGGNKGAYWVTWA